MRTWILPLLIGLLTACGGEGDGQNGKKSDAVDTPDEACSGCGETDKEKGDPMEVVAEELKDVEKVRIEFNVGTVIVELDTKNAPITVQNFIRYVEEKFYDDALVHRVMPNFVIQAGGFDRKTKQKKETNDPIQNEAMNGLRNLEGTLSMARISDPDSATSQFFINLRYNRDLDRGVRDPHGYAVFGKVVEGMDVVHKIGRSRRVDLGGAFQNFPSPEVYIKSARRIK